MKIDIFTVIFMREGLFDGHANFLTYEEACEHFEDVTGENYEDFTIKADCEHCLIGSRIEEDTIDLIPKKERTFMVHIHDSYVRDTQYVSTPEEVDSENWLDINGSILVGVIDASSKYEAIDIISKELGVSKDILIAHEIVE
ncbi:hypothetical protein [Clostridium magnum]|uniref:Uncharacterized protein n=1 Tax=Clostridium magnum DSM 2767 TaxID=1121326 RepID=A0A161X4R5_9CLOT|nr:hypothetical protein [Clostridium magnum]KZL88916.1 hypothetical protein CLMAG_58200 [Clostridium magnum DSM 2767]SHI53279.1 hypothetical protein SAMN02745944_04467 [Clostridium magnum DSM 2767]